MTKSTGIAESLVLVFSVAVAAASASAQSNLTLGTATGSPGSVVRLPIYLNLPRDHQLERIVAMVEHPPALTYHRVEVAQEAMAKEVTMEVKSPASPPGAKMKRVEVTLQGGKGKLLPTGMIGWLAFTVDQKARSQMISLPVIEATGFPTRGGAGVKLRADSGGVTIYESGMEPQPVVSCFFFTH